MNRASAETASREDTALGDASPEVTSAVDTSLALSTISCCEVCSGRELTPVLDLGLHAMCDDLVPVGDTRECQRFPIEILFCNNCITAHQKYQVPRQALFPRSYHYRSALTADVLRGMVQLVDSIEHHDGPVKGKRVLDIGCNDGSLLSVFMQRGATTHGIEPTDAAIEATAAGHQIMQRFFDVESAISFVGEFGHPDIVTFTNVFAHIENLPDVLAALRVVLGPESILVIENHYLGAVTARLQFDTFYHEHPRTYSYASFTHVASSLGREIVRLEFPSRYGGNIRVTIGAAAGASTRVRDTRDASTSPSASVSDTRDVSTSPSASVSDTRDDPTGASTSACHTHDESAIAAELQHMGARVARWGDDMRNRIQQMVNQHGPLRAKAFPGRAAIVVELLGLTPSEIREVYEQPASPKIGHYVPGTRIPIVSDKSFDVFDPSPVINLAWHIHPEIEGYMRRAGFTGEIVPVIALDQH